MTIASQSGRGPLRLWGYMGPFEVNEARDGDRLVLAVTGEIDLATAELLGGALLRAAESDAGEICVDLSDVEFMDSTGLSALVVAHKAVGDGRLVVVCPGGVPRRALEVSGLHKVLNVVTCR